MFTGIIKELGKVREFSRRGNIYRLSLESKAISKGVKIGDSVSVNGVCLTVTGSERNILRFDVVEETANKTTLNHLKMNDLVNLEDSLKVGDPLGGHFVLGHADCKGRIIGTRKRGEDIAIEIEMPEENIGFIVKKGSISVDGISLTIGEIERNRFKVYVIPHTIKSTTLGFKKTGDEVNLEFDIIGKHIARFKEIAEGGKITEEFLREKGFV